MWMVPILYAGYTKTLTTAQLPNVLPEDRPEESTEIFERLWEEETSRPEYEIHTYQHHTSYQSFNT